MEFVDGEPINAFAKTHGMVRNERLDLIGHLCAGLSHAHGRLVLHRDIKHDNVLVNSEGQLRLIDFGVASLLDDSAGADAPGPLTLGYAAPEQLLGKPVSAATDVFAVGMLTHLLETGALPKRQPDGGVAINAKAIADADLAATLAKATAFDPADRYASADAFGDDLRKITEGFPVSARPVSSFVSLKKLIARNKFASLMSGATALAVIAGLIGVGVFAVQADEARIEAEEQLAAAEYLLEETNLTQDVLQTASTLMESYIIDEKGLNELDFRAYLQDGAEEAKDFYEANPSEASARIYYVANYLNTRGDYEGSRKLSQYMIDHPDTPEIRLAEARITQGRNLRELGDNDG